MKKLLALVVVIMLAAFTVSAKSGDDYLMKKLLDFSNTLAVAGIIDSSLVKSNEANPNEEHVSSAYEDATGESLGWINDEYGDVAGLTVFNDFRMGTKIPAIVFFVDALKLKVGLSQRLYTWVRSTSITGDALFGAGTAFDLMGQYRTYFTAALEFGSDPVTNELEFEAAVRVYFNSGDGLDNARLYMTLADTIEIAKIMEIALEVEYMIRWNNEAWDDSGVVTDNEGIIESELTPALTLCSPGSEDGYDPNKFAVRAKGYKLGPVALAWSFTAEFAIAMNPSRYKDTDPGSNVDSYENGFTSAGVVDAWGTEESVQLWIDPISKMTGNKIGLNIGFIYTFEAEALYAWNLATTVLITNDIKAGVELVLDKAVVIGLLARIHLVDFANGYGAPLNGKDGTVDEYDNSAVDFDERTVTIDGVDYNAIPAGQGQIGPNIYFGVSKGAFTWMLSYHGLYNFRTWDLNGDNQLGNWNAAGGVNGPASDSYYTWRNEIETWVTFKW